MMQVQGVARAQHDTFPYSGMRVLGAFHICLGGAIFVLGVLDLVITMTSYDEDKTKYGDQYDSIVSLTVASSPIWCGMWFSVTGAIGTCISRERAYTLQFFKIVFMVLSILCAALFGPACAFLNGFIAITRHSLDSGDYQWLLTLLICFLSVVEVAMATASASVTCCCAHVKGTQVHVLVNTNNAGKRADQDPACHLDNPDGTATRWSSTSDNAINNTHDSINNNNNSHKQGREEGRTSNRVTINDIDPQVEATGSPGRAKPRVEIDESTQDGFSGSYPQLKKWALPGW
ncbi:hypothetical protein RRG08_016440 [Elysia crispata]|uniref:Transmembrane protein n=1 Tax=Elysia crispata TaxID=231223 RepID=A0AAE1CV61_9GAST|nr:hypothetical protein RRG08_016440 [Elysia crispata]